MRFYKLSRIPNRPVGPCITLVHKPLNLRWSLTFHLHLNRCCRLLLWQKGAATTNPAKTSVFVVRAQLKLASIIQTKGAGRLPFEMCAGLYHKTVEDEFIVCKEMISGEILLGI